MLAAGRYLAVAWQELRDLDSHKAENNHVKVRGCNAVSPFETVKR